MATLGVGGGNARPTVSVMHLADTLAGHVSSGTMPSGGQRIPSSSSGPSSSSFKYTFGTRGFAYITKYMTSPWALLCILMAIVLNRTLVYASLRRPARLSRRIRLAIRIIPIGLFIIQIRSILFALRCQTSPHLPIDIFPQASHIPYAPSDTGTFLYYLSRLLTAWKPTHTADVEVCQIVGMLPMDPNDTTTELSGSLQLLWPLYKTIALSLFLSTFSHVLSGPATGVGTALGPSTSSDTGLTLFEDSLAFAEAEFLADTATGNVAPEVLYIALISCFAHLTANLIGVFASQPARPRGGSYNGVRYRLITTGIWGIAFLGGFAWSLVRAVMGDIPRDGTKSDLLGFPKVCIVGFLPHLVIVAGIFTCGWIYLLAAIVSSIAAPPSSSARRTRRPLVSFGNGDADFPRGQDDTGDADGLLAFGNLQATITLSTLTLSLHEDFYTTLLKTGFLVLTTVSDATFLQEGEYINTPLLTWMERERVKVYKRKLEWERRRKGREVWVMEKLKQGAKRGVSGYANERKNVEGWMVGLPEKDPRRLEGEKLEDQQQRGRRRERGGGEGRWAGAMELVKGVVAVAGSGFVEGLRRMGVLTPVRRGGAERTPREGQVGEVIPRPGEHLGQRRVTREERHGGAGSVAAWMSEDEKLYTRFLRGELTPDDDDDDDNSGEYIPDPRHLDEDTTSLISYSSSTHNNNYHSNPNSDSDSDDGDDGSRTPTRAQPRPYPSSSPEPEPDPLHQLARLLDPQTAEQRHMARIMARHLLADKTERKYVTRSSIVGTSRSGPVAQAGKAYRFDDGDYVGGGQDDEEGERLLEFIGAVRGDGGIGNGKAGDGGVLGLGLGHPGVGECVVCQTAARTVVIWPCRCLSLCEECRMALAARGFARCVCCRGEVGGFSRLFVP